jgi:hypothetical protein
MRIPSRVRVEQVKLDVENTQPQHNVSTTWIIGES